MLDKAYFQGFKRISQILVKEEVSLSSNPIQNDLKNLIFSACFVFCLAPEIEKEWRGGKKFGESSLNNHFQCISNLFAGKELRGRKLPGRTL